MGSGLHSWRGPRRRPDEPPHLSLGSVAERKCGSIRETERPNGNSKPRVSLRWFESSRSLLRDEECSYPRESQMLIRQCDLCRQPVGDDYVHLTLAIGKERTQYRDMEICQVCLPYGNGAVTAGGLLGAIKRVLGLSKNG